MDPFKNTASRSILAQIAIAISVIAIGVSLASFVSTRSNGPAQTSHSVPSVLKHMADTGTLTAGYGVYPPYTNEDPNTKAVSGFSIDLVERIAKELGVKVVWHRVSWSTFIPDIQRGDYDLIADPILMTIPRSNVFSFTVPYDYFADGVVVVRKNDKRFKTFNDLDRSDVKIAVGKGFASETIAKSQLPKAELILIQMGTDMQQLFNEVASGRVDATMSEGPSAAKYIAEHSGVVKSLNLDHPAALIAGAFALRFDDPDGARAFSVSLDFLRNTGEIAALRKKWGLPATDEPRK